MGLSETPGKAFTQSLWQKEKAGESYSDTVEALISRAKIPVKAVLGNSVITVADFSQLQVGDIVRLDTKVDEELDVFVGDIRKFAALPGASGKEYAVRVTQIIREE